MRIDSVLLAPARGAFFYDDQAAIRAGVASDGFLYVGTPVTPGFRAIRIPAEALSVGLQLEDGEVVWGDMMGVQYSGAGGRDPLFSTEAAERLTLLEVAPRLRGLDITDFRAATTIALAPRDNGARLPLAIEYGVSQALLWAAARAARLTPAEVICNAFGLPLVVKAVPLYAQSGDARQINVDKMILKRVDVLPHGLINARDKFGPNGETFREFAKWVAGRVSGLGGASYRPVLHFDLYGWIGLEIGTEPTVVAEFIARLADDLKPFLLNIECPADYGDRDAQIENYAAIAAELRRFGSDARIVVDERCNTLDDIKAFAAAGAGHIIQIKMPDVGSVADTILGAMACRANDVGAYVGGSCVETDLSARLSVHVAVATQADMMLAKPGMGVDEGLSIVGNEQSRLLCLLNAREHR
jgi:methylaspartate ammonia-lyase